MTQPDDAVYGAVDLGGTKILSLAVDANGEVLGEDLRPTEAHEGPGAVLRRIADSVSAAVRAAGPGRRLAGAGVAAPGPIDFERGMVADAPNLPGWHNVPVAAQLGDLLRCTAVLENDANAAAYGEFRLGAGRGVRHLVYLTVSTGVGGGLVLDGRLYRGANGAAGELGHIPLTQNGPLCGCGAHGCLEQLASGTAIARRAREVLGRNGAPLLARLVAGGTDVSAEVVHQAALQGDLDAREVIDAAGRHLGAGLVAFVNIFNPDVIVIGGGAAKIGPMLLEPALAEMRARAFRIAREHVRVVPAELGDRAGALGAAMLAMERVTSG